MELVLPSENSSTVQKNAHANSFLMLFKAFNIIFKVLNVSWKVVIYLDACIGRTFMKYCQVSRYLKKLDLFLVLKLWILEFCLNSVFLVTINRAKESIYWDARGNIVKILKNSLQESLGLASNNILIIPFRSLKIFKLWEEAPQNISPYVIIEWKYAW
jgi:hypothetical protein